MILFLTDVGTTHQLLCQSTKIGDHVQRNCSECETEDTSRSDSALGKVNDLKKKIFFYCFLVAFYLHFYCVYMMCNCTIMHQGLVPSYTEMSMDIAPTLSILSS